MANDPGGPGQKVGRYQILEELGRGAMGVVYKGHDPVIGRTVALKTIAFREDDASDSLHLRQRLYREACAAGTLAHPNIVTVYDVIEEGGMTAVAMEFIEGQTLKDLIGARAPLPLEEALDIYEQIVDALDYAAAKKIVHRDIKPANIMIAADGRVKVADFGLARMPASNMTKGGAIMGTPSYMSPEQTRGRLLDGRSDVFSATVVMYEMVTGNKPFKGKNLPETLELIANSPPTPPTKYNPAIGPAVTAVFDRAFAKEPDKRYRSGADVVSAMRQALKTKEDATVDLDAKTVLMDAKTLKLPPPKVVGSEAKTMRLPPPVPAAPEPVLKTVRVEPPKAASDVDPVLQPEVRAPATKAASAKGLAVAMAAAAVVLGALGLVAFISMRNRGTPPASPANAGPPAAAASSPPAAAPSQPPPAPAPIETRRIEAPSATIPDPRARASAKAEPPPARPSTPTQPAAPPVSTDPPPRETPRASLQFAFDGSSYPVSIVADGRRVGQASDGSIPIEAGRVRLRAVNEQLFLDHDFGAITLNAGERRTLSLPGVTSAFVGVRGDNYTGLRILLDGRVLAGPYPAQPPRLSATPHKIQFRWDEGVLQGVEIADTIDLSGGRHFIIRAIPDEGRVSVQKVR